MQGLLLSVIQSGNSEQIKRYVDKYIPNQNNNLERIYKQLQRYKTPVKLPLGQESTQKRLEKTKKSKQTVAKTPIQQSIRRTKSIMLFLRQKGVQIKQQNYQKGIAIAQKQKNKFMKPLQSNPVSIFLRKSKINELCQKYQLNKQFYQNLCPEYDYTKIGFDPVMFEFIEKRKKLLKLIQQKNHNTLIGQDQPKKYRSVQSRLNKCNSSSVKNFRILNIDNKNNQASLKNMIASQARHVIQQCNRYEKMKILTPSTNLFLDLKLKVNSEEEVDIDAALKTKVKNSVTHEKLERYNLPYMTYLKQKQDRRSMSTFRKQLLKDQIKMRGIVDFQD